MKPQLSKVSLEAYKTYFEALPDSQKQKYRKSALKIAKSIAFNKAAIKAGYTRRNLGDKAALEKLAKETIPVKLPQSAPHVLAWDAEHSKARKPSSKAQPVKPSHK